MDVIRLYVGFDPREAIAYHVFCQSVLNRASRPVSFTPLALNVMKDDYSEVHTDGSNQFIYSRFLVPYLCGFTGWAIFVDGDMLCRDDIAKLWRQRDSSKAVQVVHHDYDTRFPVKYLGQKNESYPKKNWSSVMLWNCSHPANSDLTPECIMRSSGRFLHRFEWLRDTEIGFLSPSWNWLVSEYDKDDAVSLVHFTLGTPCFKGYETCDYADEWYAELHDMLKVNCEGNHAWIDGPKAPRKGRKQG